jgi:predicted regulator of Ras-like GTPase activity (Roadblock/LC7/MglB family)
VDAVLQQLGQIPGVVGTVIYDREGTVEASRFPALFDRATLDHVAAALAQDAYLEEWLQGPAACLDLRFGEGRVVLRGLPGAWLLVLCTAQVNAQLLNLSLTQGLRRLQRSGVRASAPPPPEPPSPVAPPSPAAPPPVSPPPAPDPVGTMRAQLVAIAEAELGTFAPQALELFERAGSLGELASAAAEVEQMTRLFVSRKKADELARQLRAAFEKGGKR